MESTVGVNACRARGPPSMRATDSMAATRPATASIAAMPPTTTAPVTALYIPAST